MTRLPLVLWGLLFLALGTCKFVHIISSLYGIISSHCSITLSLNLCQFASHSTWFYYLISLLKFIDVELKQLSWPKNNKFIYQIFENFNFSDRNYDFLLIITSLRMKIWFTKNDIIKFSVSHIFISHIKYMPGGNQIVRLSYVY